MKIDGAATAVASLPHVNSIFECLGWLNLQPDETYFSPLLMSEFFGRPPPSALADDVIVTASAGYVCSCPLVPGNEERARAVGYNYQDDPCAVGAVRSVRRRRLLSSRSGTAAVPGPWRLLRLAFHSVQRLRMPGGWVLHQECANPIIGVAADEWFYPDGALAA